MAGGEVTPRGHDAEGIVSESDGGSAVLPGVKSEKVARGAPPARRFGRAMLSEWMLEPQAAYLNHGTVGAAPRRVLAVQQAIQAEMERHPARFMIRELADVRQIQMRARPRMRVAADAVAAFVEARSQDLMFVDNTTSGVNAVLRSLSFAAGEEILLTDHGYGAMKNVADYVARRSGASVRVIELPGPPFDADRITAAIAAAFRPATRLLLVDHVTSGSALIFPLAAIAARARAAGVRVLADGAHVPGALPLDIPKLGVDWYTANLHKWAMAPRSSAFLWADPARQEDLHPPVISWGYGKGLDAEFDLTGTRDPSPWLASPAGIDFMRDLGLDEMRAYNHGFVMDAARTLCQRWEIELPAPQAMYGCMVTLQLPGSFGTTAEDATRLKDGLFDEHDVELSLFEWKGRLWMRLCGQVYNDVSDIDRLIRGTEALVKR
jgi:isopenicillin-N epimerase